MDLGNEQQTAVKALTAAEPFVAKGQNQMQRGEDGLQAART